MKHTIKTASGAISIEPAGKPGIEFVLVTVKPTFFPSFDIQLTAEQSGLLAQAFDLATEEITGPDDLTAARMANMALDTGEGIRA